MSKVKEPSFGTKVTMDDEGNLIVPNNPVVPYIEGDGIGVDIWAATVRVLDAAVSKAYSEERKIDYLPEVKFGSPLNQLEAFQKCFPVIPDLLELELLDIAGRVFFEGSASLKGKVRLKGINKTMHIENGRHIENESIEC